MTCHSSTTSADALLKVRGLYKRYHAQGPWIVNDVDFDLVPGEILSLVGPSGCGKTTTLRLIAGFEQADAGTIDLQGQPLVDVSESRRFHLPPEKRGVGIVFQDYALFPHLTVLGNVTYGIRQGSAKEKRDQAMKQLEMLNMASLADRRPQTLSGGQQQRVALARTIAANPRVVLLDEPFSNLDVTLRESARRDVRQTLLSQGVAAILVTHDREEAMSIGDRVAVMNQGRIVQIGRPESLYHEPVDCFVASFLGGLVQLPAQAVGSTATTMLGPVMLSRSVQGQVIIALRPEQIILSTPSQGQDQGIIEHREFRGHDQLLMVRYGLHTIPVLADSKTSYHCGQAVSLRIEGQAIVFDRCSQCTPQ